MNDMNHADANANAAPQRATSPGWLRGLRQAIGFVHARPPVRLAIEGLPDKWSVLGRGRIHGIYAEAGTRACDSLIWNTARDAAMANVTVVRALPRAEVASQLRALGFVQGQHAQGWPRHFNVLSLPPAAYDATIPRGAAGATSLGTALRALQRAGLRPRSLCIIEGAERWFNWHDPVALHREAEMLASWCARRQVSMVLILAPRIVDAESSSDNVASAHTCTHDVLYTFHLHFSGVARLDQVAGELRWHVDFWRAGRALVAGETCALRVDEAARLVALPLQGQFHTGALADDWRKVLAASQPDPTTGYVPMGSFCERVTAALQRGAPLLLPHVLVELSLRPDVAHLDALRACQPQRPGEFVTVCGSHLYLFLFGCRPPDVEAALARIIDVPVPQLFDCVTLYPEHASTEQVEALRDRQRHARAPDYSEVLSAGKLASELAGELATYAAAIIDVGAGGYATAIGAGTVARRVLHPVNGQGQGQGQEQPGHARRAEPCAMPLNHQEIA